MGDGAPTLSVTRLALPTRVVRIAPNRAAAPRDSRDSRFEQPCCPRSWACTRQRAGGPRQVLVAHTFEPVPSLSDADYAADVMMLPTCRRGAARRGRQRLQVSPALLRRRHSAAGRASAASIRVGRRPRVGAWVWRRIGIAI